MVNQKTKEVDSVNYDILVSPIVTEKSQIASAFNKYTFYVSPRANKASIKSSVEAIFKVDVVSVAVLNRKGKTKVFKGVKGKRKNNKIAIVTIADNQSLDLGLGN